jgi:glycosyltransferase involved in cell wall biosynthesis
MMPVSLVIPTYNRYDFLTECLAFVLEDDRIGEIVLSDDASTDGSFEKLHSLFETHPKVKLYQNEQNLDCYRNKHAAVERATWPWVILFDDDNIMPVKYLDTLFALLKWEDDVVYCPEYAEPHFDYTAFAGETITRENVHLFADKPHFFTALNTANYFFHRDDWLRVWDYGAEPNTADSIYQAYRLLNGGKRMTIVPGLRYFHRVHAGSHYKNNVHKTKDFAKEVERKLKGLE